MMEEKVQDTEKIIFEKDICPECLNKMSKLGKVYKCFRCGIMVEI